MDFKYTKSAQYTRDRKAGVKDDLVDVARMSFDGLKDLPFDVVEG